MATYDPAQPMSKRIVAGILDFLLAFFVFGYALGKIFPAAPHAPPNIPGATSTELFSLSGWPALLLVALIAAYFVVLGRTGGTVFQRLLGMKRARRAMA
jgi:hypothetical protein